MGWWERMVAAANPYGIHGMQLSLVESCLPILFKPKSAI